MSDYILVLVSAALINNLMLQPDPIERDRLQALGLCSALLILLSLPTGLLLQQYVLAPLQLQNLRLFLLLPLLAMLAWGLPQLLRRVRPGWPVEGLQELLLGNVAVLGLLLQLGSDGSSGWQALTWGVAGGLGFWLALLLFADLRERSRHTEVPTALRGLPIELIGAGVMAMALSGLSGLFTQ